MKCCMPCVPPKRYPGCHDHCPEYAAEKAEDQKKKELDRQRRAVIGSICDQRARAVQKAKKKHRVKWGTY